MRRECFAANVCLFLEPTTTDFPLLAPVHSQAELMTYVHHLVKRYNLGDVIQLKSKVTDAKWDDQAGQWTVTVANANSGESEQWTAKWLVFGTGCLSSPNVPKFPGAEDFKELYHTGLWLVLKPRIFVVAERISSCLAAFSFQAPRQGGRLQGQDRRRYWYWLFRYPVHPCYCRGRRQARRFPAYSC